MMRVPSLNDGKNEECLLFHLAGPMSSWGGIAVGSIRPTEMHPSKSAVVGIISASLGIDRLDSERQASLFTDFDYVIVSSGKEGEMSDYATIQSSRPPSEEKYTILPPRSQELARESLNTILSTKRYVCNGFYTVAIIPRVKPAFDLQRIKDALERPVFIPYLGRKSCPMSFPMSPSIEYYDDLMELLKDKSLWPFMSEWMQSAAYLDKHILHVYSTFRIDAGSVVERRMRDDMPERRSWQFKTRSEYEYLVMPE